MRTTYKGEIVAIQPGQYTVYVFKNLDEPDNSLLRYVTVTRPPNWNYKNLQMGDTGFFECEYVTAGEQYYRASTGDLDTYNYTVCYLLNFIEEKRKILTKEFNF